jgi:hypothetical protein
MRTAPTINGKPCPDWLLEEFIDYMVATAREPVEQLDLPTEFARFLANKYGTRVTGEKIDGTERIFVLPEGDDA